MVERRFEAAKEEERTKKEGVGEKGRQAKGRTSANVSVAAP